MCMADFITHLSTYIYSSREFLADFFFLDPDFLRDRLWII